MKEQVERWAVKNAANISFALAAVNVVAALVKPQFAWLNWISAGYSIKSGLDFREKIRRDEANKRALEILTKHLQRAAGAFTGVPANKVQVCKDPRLN